MGSPYAHWPLGAYVCIYSGKDGHMHSAKLQVGEKQSVRLTDHQILSIKALWIEVSILSHLFYIAT